MVQTTLIQVLNLVQRTQSFTEEQLALFEHRYENGYNLYIDEDYVSWLQHNHPESLPDDLQDLFSSDVSLHVHSSTPITELSREEETLNINPTNSTESSENLLPVSGQCSAASVISP